jgi:hypothetical protein
MNKVLERLIRWSLVLATMAGIAVTQKPQSAEAVASTTPIDQFEFPSQVLIERRLVATKELSGYCGGAIINSTTVISSANCVSVIHPSWEFIVYAGNPAPDISFANPYKQTRYVTKIISHPTYSCIGTPCINDIAILKLNTSLVFNKAIAPARLPSNNVLYTENNKFFQSGWLYNKEWSRKSNMVSINQIVCKYFFRKITNSMGCAYNTYRDFFLGSPIYITYSGKQYLIGMATINSGRGPQYYTKLLHFKSWITSVIR